MSWVTPFYTTNSCNLNFLGFNHNGDSFYIFFNSMSIKHDYWDALQILALRFILAFIFADGAEIGIFWKEAQTL